MEQQRVNFYHDTTSAMCTKEKLCVNTHRTDFVGFESANKCFNIISPKVKFPDGRCYQITDDMIRLKDLAVKLMTRQGSNFFLNEYPEECEHRQFIDLDANVSSSALDNIINCLEALTTDGRILVLRNTISGKVHLVMDVPALSSRGSLRKKAINQYLCDYLYDEAALEDEFTREKWRDEVFDAKAAGIRSAFSAKVKCGKLESPGFYAPPGIDAAALSIEEKAAILCDYSIYVPPTSRWTEEALAEFALAETKLVTEMADKVEKHKIESDYNAEAKTISFLGKNQKVNGALINAFIRSMPKRWADKRHWGIMTRNVKCAATLASDFDPAFYLHDWSAQDDALYNKEGNDDYYARCQIDVAKAGESLTWLRNMAGRRQVVDPDFYRGDMGLADIFANISGGNIKVVSDDASAYLWDESSFLWKLRNNKWIGNEISVRLERHIDLQLAVVRETYKGITVDHIVKDLGRIKKQIMSHSGAMAVVHKASPLLEDMDFITKINLQPDLLPIKDGLVVDLKTGEATRRLPEHNFTFECPVSIDRDPAKRELVAKFMLDICTGDQSLLDYLQVALGYCITGRVNEKAVFILWGEKGDNGKSTLMNLLKAMLGIYCKSASKSVFIKSKSDSKLTPEREVLKDSRMVMFSETTADDALNDEVLKMASGDDPIRVNPKYQAEYEFRSYSKLLIASNHKPKINVSDAAMVKRVKFIPFLTRFVPHPAAAHERFRDVQLVARMEGDLLNAFFTWILDGAARWYQSGLIDVPAVMRKETEEYLAENDEIGEFLADETEVAADQFVPSAGLYRKYCDWCRGRNATPKGAKTFSQDMEKRFKKDRKKIGQVFVGLRFKVPADLEEGFLEI
jgi:P4 family phage/plasmid primase-like protien